MPRVHLQHRRRAVTWADVSGPTLRGKDSSREESEEGSQHLSLVYIHMDFHKSEDAEFKCSGNYASAQRNVMCSYIMN